MADVASVTAPAAALVATPPAAADAPAVAVHTAPRVPKAPAYFADKDSLFKNVCRSFMNRKCTRGASCHRMHDKQLCSNFYCTGTCKYGDECRKNHFVTISKKKSSGGEEDEKDASAVTDAEASNAAADHTIDKESNGPETFAPVRKSTTPLALAPETSALATRIVPLAMLKPVAPLCSDTDPPAAAAAPTLAPPCNDTSPPVLAVLDPPTTRTVPDAPPAAELSPLLIVAASDAPYSMAPLVARTTSHDAFAPGIAEPTVTSLLLVLAAPLPLETITGPR